MAKCKALILFFFAQPLLTHARFLDSLVLGANENSKAVGSTATAAPNKTLADFTRKETDSDG